MDTLHQEGTRADEREHASFRIDAVASGDEIDAAVGSANGDCLRQDGG